MLADAGSIPAISTNNKGHRFSVAFFIAYDPHYRPCIARLYGLRHFSISYFSRQIFPDRPNLFCGDRCQHTFRLITLFKQPFLFQFYAPAHRIQKIIADVVHSISRYYSKTRPGRHYERKSMRPTKKWNSGWGNTASGCLTNTGPFSNLHQPSPYWSATEYAPDTSAA